MKKTIAALFALTTAAVFAGAGDLLISFSTPGPDKYADGTTVKDGECYALVYTKGETQEKVLVYPGAKNGCCPTVVFIVDEIAAAKYTGGTWGVYLLDTRVFTTDENGDTKVEDNLSGLTTGENCMVAVADDVANASGFGTANASAGVTPEAHLSNVKQPRVTGIKIVGANVVVTVADTVPFAGYTLQSGDDVVNFSVPEGAKAVNGSASEGEINLVAPKKEGAQFFKVSTATVK